jgi:hypothetical protein
MWWQQDPACRRDGQCSASGGAGCEEQSDWGHERCAQLAAFLAEVEGFGNRGKSYCRRRVC